MLMPSTTTWKIENNKWVWYKVPATADTPFGPAALPSAGGAVKTVLDIPAGLDVLAILPFGYPARAVGKGQKQRKPLREVAHSERYGRPFESKEESR